MTCRIPVYWQSGFLPRQDLAGWPGPAQCVAVGRIGTGGGTILGRLSALPETITTIFEIQPRRPLGRAIWYQAVPLLLMPRMGALSPVSKASMARKLVLSPVRTLALTRAVTRGVSSGTGVVSSTIVSVSTATSSASISGAAATAIFDAQWPQRPV